uniref:Uncharacterized protein n=1 Tax=Eutreptiella gymnastica TaxID=73025 RepID=A0A7S1NKA6_9EUGL
MRVANMTLHKSNHNKGSNGAKRPRTKQEEKNRVDAAMEHLEAAKHKAQQQKEEYGKYLKWKVKAQKKERLQREKEEADQRERVQQQLQVMMKEHRHHKREQAKGYYQAPPNKVSAPVVEESHGEQGLRNAQKPMDLELRPNAPAPLSELNELNEAQFTPSPPRSRRATSMRKAESRSNPFDALRERITFEDVLRLPVLEKQAASLLVQQPTNQSPRTPPSKKQTYFGKPTGADIQRAQARLQKVENMFNKARARKEHAAESREHVQ